MVESILVEEQAGFRKKRSTTEQILNFYGGKIHLTWKDNLSNLY